MHSPSWALLAVVAVATCSSAVEIGKASYPVEGAVSVDVFPSGAIRMRVTPPDPELYAVEDVVVGPSQPATHTCTDRVCVVKHGDAELRINLDGLQADLIVGGNTVTSLTVGPTENSKVEGTFTFPLAAKLYGIPERAVDLALKNGLDYRLWNLDVFQYKLDDTKGIYGTIPFLMAHGPKHTTGILWLNSADTTVSVTSPEGGEGASTKWSSEHGIYDVTFFPGSTPVAVHKQHAEVVGNTFLPPQFSLGYHQCRWNYRSSEDCLDVDKGFDTHNIPYDVLWLDIEHTDGKKYFTWDNHNFPKPKELVASLASRGRKLVTITDPHIKSESGYHVHEGAKANKYYVQTEGGTDFEGHCWPGTSHWIDFYSPSARAWYATLFHYDSYESTKDIYTWIDMNEPSVFNAHEVTMDKNAIHIGREGKRVKHRDVHNMYGFYHTMAAFDGHLSRNRDEPSLNRPFILTRSFFSGSQRYCAMWTGDNMAEWSHLQKSIPMLLTLSISNFPFVGADVGGFFNNPDEKLVVRWYQAGAFYPFFRGHAHLETKRREPWLFGDQATALIRRAIAMRYALMPYMYTTFFRSHVDGYPVIRPLFYDFPAVSEYLEEQGAYLFGQGLLVRPITGEHDTQVTVPLPTDAVWYSYPNGNPIDNSAGSITLPVDETTMPVFVRGGFILPTRQRLRRSTSAQADDPFTLIVAVDASGNAEGFLFLDDALTFDYDHGAFAYRRFTFDHATRTLRGAAAETTFKPARSPAKKFESAVTIERVVIMGLKGSLAIAATQAVAKENGAVRAVTVQAAAFDQLVIRKPDVRATGDWEIKLE